MVHSYIHNETLIQNMRRYILLITCTCTYAQSIVCVLNCSFFSSSLFLSRWYNKPVSVLDLPSPITVNCHVTCSDATKVLSDNGIDQVPVVGDNR